MDSQKILRFLKYACVIALIPFPSLFAHDGEHPARDLSGNWQITFKVLVGGGECSSLLGDVTIEQTSIRHIVELGRIELTGILDNPNEVIEGHVMRNEEGQIIMTYEGQFREDGGWTERYMEFVVAEDFKSMEGFEDWEWGLSSNPNAPDDCPNSRSSISAVRVEGEFPPLPIAYSPPILSFNNQLTRMMQLTPDGNKVLGLSNRHGYQFFNILLGNPEIGGATEDPLSIAKDALISVAQNKPFHVEVGQGGQLERTYQAWQPASAAFLSGEGADFTITQEMVNEAVALRDLVYAEASDELKADIDAELSNLEQAVGQNVNQFFNTFGIDEANLSVFVYSGSREEEQFRLNLDELPGVAYTLYKSDSLNEPNWVEVEGTLIEITNAGMSLIDPNPGTDRVYYRVEANTE